MNKTCDLQVVETEVINEIRNERGHIVWKCPVLNDDSTLRPAGLTPRKGCGHWNRMTTKHRRVPEIFQTSPCAKCLKRTRKVGLMTYFDNLLDAMLYIDRKRNEETQTPQDNDDAWEGWEDYQ